MEDQLIIKRLEEILGIEITPAQATEILAARQEIIGMLDRTKRFKPDDITLHYGRAV